MILEIDAKGYVYPSAFDSNRCIIGLAGTDINNRFRLGTVFLRSFQTVMDFDLGNMIIAQKTGFAQLYQPNNKPDSKKDPSPS